MELVGKDGVQPAIRILLNYWECSPEEIRTRLDGLLKDGFSQVTSFVPWQAFESDISHKLMKFLQAVSERKMSVSLILSPEVGVHHMNSGIPRDLLGSEETHARRADGAPFVLPLPPRWHSLPSLHSPEMMKRYWAFLARFVSFVSDLDRAGSSALKGMSLVLTGSYWKYYRSPLSLGFDHVRTAACDESRAATTAYLRHLSDHYGQPEFSDPDAAASKRWKTRAFEEVNRRQFSQAAEDQFRVQSEQILQRRYVSVPIEQLEMFTPEADPGYVYAGVFQALADGRGDFHRLSKLLDAATTRETVVGRKVCRPCVHWTAFGGFRTLNDSQKQFLVLKTLLLMGSRGGSVLLDDREWRELSPSFRKRAELMSRRFAMGGLKLRTMALHLTSHTWSAASELWSELERALGPEARVTASLASLAAHPGARLLVVDASMILRHDVVKALMDWAAEGRTLALPQTNLYTESARAELTKRVGDASGRTRGAASRAGITHQTYPLGKGRVVFYDSAEREGTESREAWRGFAAELLEGVGASSRCQLSDGRLMAIPLERATADANSLGIFVLNGTARPVTADVLFRGPVRVSDLAVAISDAPPPNRGGSESARRFGLEVPPCGILPLQVEGDVLAAEAVTATPASKDSEAPRDAGLDAAAAVLGH